MSILDVVTQLGGVVHQGRLLPFGYTASDARRAVRGGMLLRPRQGWVATPDAADADVSAVRVGGSLTCLSVLRSAGIWCIDDGLLHVRVGVHTTHLASPHSRTEPLGDPAANGVSLHRAAATAGPRPPRARDDVEWALMHMVACQPRDHAVAAFDSALNQKLTTRRRLSLLADQLSQKHRDVLALADSSAQSGLETKARLRLRARHIPYRTQVYIPPAGAVDLLIGDRLVIELDGREWHTSDEAFFEDRRRDFEFHEQGRMVRRFTYAQVMFEWGRIEAMIRGTVKRGEHRWSRRQLAAGLGRPGAGA
ncbi:hypothetical protein B7R54_04595 [Subtercola boreus]|uniref:DUF559 domain-containing protein n=1 Tax=Subtercola boreus TaxID=120213 RepID=A0A3E0VF71_9MICO|nr:hypothetical protein [Subtercola boreus]RFA08584.1 hypothetical protein B7R54_04595 [Subtercola boreus]TQL54478.1 hypothetical protein FB464_2017 [Subtercola boreus]